jgi:hypothetical protein
MPITLLTQEAEIGRMTIPDQPEQKIHRTPSQEEKLDTVVYMCHPRFAWNTKIGGLWDRPAHEKSKT